MAVVGVNSQKELNAAAIHKQQCLIDYWQQRGVTIEHDDVLIGPLVQLAPGVIIERGATLLGRTIVGQHSHIEHHVHLKNMVVGEHCRIRSFSYAEDSQLHNRVQLGPMAHSYTLK